MPKSERSALEWTLAGIERGAHVEVVDVLAEDPEPLFVHGIRPGARLSIEGDAPFGGPRIVRIAGSRVAIGRRLTRTVRVTRVRGDTSEVGQGSHG